MHHAHIDKFAYQDSAIHRLDARIKFIAAVAYSLVVISLPKTSLSLVLCSLVGPFAVLVIAEIPLKFILRQMIIVSPFIVMLALTSIFYDRTEVVKPFGPFKITTTVGVLRCISIVLKFAVTITTLMALICTTKFNLLLTAMNKLGMPRLLTIELGLLYRYIFVLIDKAQHILRARAIRKLRNLGFKRELKISGAMAGSLFLSSLETSSRVNMAMDARGFDGQFRCISQLKIGRGDYVFITAFVSYLIGLYFIGTFLV